MKTSALLVELSQNSHIFCDPKRSELRGFHYLGKCPFISAFRSKYRSTDNLQVDSTTDYLTLSEQVKFSQIFSGRQEFLLRELYCIYIDNTRGSKGRISIQATKSLSSGRLQPFIHQLCRDYMMAFSSKSRKSDCINGHRLSIFSRNETPKSWQLSDEENSPCKRTSEDNAACVHTAADKLRKKRSLKRALLRKIPNFEYSNGSSDMSYRANRLSEILTGQDGNLAGLIRQFI